MRLTVRSGLATAWLVLAGGCLDDPNGQPDAGQSRDTGMTADAGVDDGPVDAAIADRAAHDSARPDAAQPDTAPDAGNPCDQDSDGVRDAFCGGPDCDPGNPNIPAAAEDCDNGVDDDCNGDADWQDSACAPANDTCASAEDISAGGTITSWTDGAQGDYGSNVFGPDVVYQFTLQEPKVATVRLTVPAPPPPPPANLEVDFNLFVGAECPPNGGVWSSYYCAGSGGFCQLFPGSVEQCSRLAAGTYWAVVQVGTRNVWPQTGYLFALDLELLDPPGLACGSLTDVASGGSFPIDPGDARWVDARGYCGADGTREALFDLTLDAPTNVMLTTPDEQGELYLLPTCDATTTPLHFAPPQMNLPAGSYVVVKELGPLVWPATASHLHVALDPPRLACADAVAISGTGSHSGTTAGGQNRLVTNPYPDVRGYGPEVVFRLVLATQQRVVADLIPMYDGAILYFETECGVSDSADYYSFDPAHKDKTLAPGTYYLVVDGDAATDAGDFILNVTLL